MNPKTYFLSYIAIFLSFTLITIHSYASLQTIEEVVEAAIKDNETSTKINDFFDIIHKEISATKAPESKEARDKICKEWRGLLTNQKSFFHDNAYLADKLETALEGDDEALLKHLLSEDGLKLGLPCSMVLDMYEFRYNVSKINQDGIKTAAKERCFEDCIEPIVKRTKTITLEQLLLCIAASVRSSKA